MPGWYIHMDVARKALDDLAANATAAPIFSSQGLSAAQVRNIARANPAYAALGAIGPDIFFLLPDYKPPVGQMLWKLASAIIELYTAWDDNFLGPFESAMGPIGNNLADEENALTGGLKDTLETIFAEANSILHDFILKLILEQYDFFGLLSSGLQAGVDEQTFFWSDMFHYRETSRFAAVLWQRASDPTIVRTRRIAPGSRLSPSDGWRTSRQTSPGMLSSTRRSGRPTGYIGNGTIWSRITWILRSTERTMVRSRSTIKWPMPRFICGSRSIRTAPRATTFSTPSQTRPIRQAITAPTSPAVTPSGMSTPTCPTASPGSWLTR